jgi:hypothetical protein
VKQDLDMKLSDKDCKKPTRANIVAKIGKNKQADVDKIDVHFVDLNEPGRSSCMSTDECGAYLAHMVQQAEGQPPPQGPSHLSCAGLKD